MSVIHNAQCATEYKGKHECNDERARRYKKKAIKKISDMNPYD